MTSLEHIKLLRDNKDVCESECRSVAVVGTSVDVIHVHIPHISCRLTSTALISCHLTQQLPLQGLKYALATGPIKALGRRGL